MTEDTRLCDDALSVARRLGNKALEDGRIVSNILPVLLGGRAEMYDVCAGEVSAKHSQQLVLREQAGEL